MYSVDHHCLVYFCAQPRADKITLRMKGFLCFTGQMAAVGSHTVREQREDAVLAHLLLLVQSSAPVPGKTLPPFRVAFSSQPAPNNLS